MCKSAGMEAACESGEETPPTTESQELSVYGLLSGVAPPGLTQTLQANLFSSPVLNADP